VAQALVAVGVNSIEREGRIEVVQAPSPSPHFHAQAVVGEPPPAALPAAPPPMIATSVYAVFDE
jgi:hypothetical protein